MTNPLLFLSNGSEHFSGSSTVESAVNAVKPATPTGQILASVPPASITSASPHWILRYASPMECVPVAHAVTTFRLFLSVPVESKHFLLPCWRSSVEPEVDLLWKVLSPQFYDMPSLLPADFDSRSDGTSHAKRIFFSISSPACSNASFAAATAYWQNNSILFAALKSI